MKLPRNIVPPAPKGPPRQRISGAGKHAQGIARQRTRGQARRAALQESAA